MMKNDLGCMLPDENGVRVCQLALRELSHFAVAIVDRVEAEGYLNSQSFTDGFVFIFYSCLCRASESKLSEGQAGADISGAGVLTATHSLVESVNEMLTFCKFEEADLPPALDLTGALTSDPDDQTLTQYRDSLAWNVPPREADPGQDVSLRKYLPVDLLQVNLDPKLVLYFCLIHVNKILLFYICRFPNARTPEMRPSLLFVNAIDCAR